MRKRFSCAGVVPGRIGTKRSDWRFRAPDGSEWDSKFEWQVFDALTKQGHRIRRCERGLADSVPYTQRILNAACGACGSDAVGKRRSYTADFLHDPERKESQRETDDGRFLVELKGYLRADERGLLRALCKARPDLRLVFIFQRDFTVSRRSGLKATDWVEKYLKKPAIVWKGKIPNEWLSNNGQWLYPNVSDSSARPLNGGGKLAIRKGRETTS